MITLADDHDNVEICKLHEKKKKTPVYWHPRIRKDLRSAVENLNSFNTEKFRDRFELSQDQASNIFGGLKTNDVCETHQTKFFKCKEFIKIINAKNYSVDSAILAKKISSLISKISK